MSNQMMEGREEDCSAASPDTKSESLACPEVPQTPRRKKKKNINNNRRFNDEQIRLLESIFESETKLEPRKKMQLARELGLQPRQIAIWFQNKRARWKSKQIEQQYKTLRTNYDNLASRFESLQNEKQSLLVELQKLNELLGSPCEGNRSCKELEARNTGIGSVYGNTSCDAEAQQGLDNRVVFTCSQNDKSKHSGLFGDEEHSFLNRSEYTDGSLATPDQRWYSFDSSGPFDMTCSSNSQWFNFWT